jgi:hypothetical protein
MRLTSRIPAPDGAIFGIPVRLGDNGAKVRIGDRVIGEVVAVVAVEGGNALDLTMEMDDEWANSVGLGNIGRERP